MWNRKAEAGRYFPVEEAEMTREKGSFKIPRKP